MNLMTKIAIGAVLTAMSMLTIGTSASAAGRLRILTWEGYADKDWVEQFEKETGAQVDVVFAGSDDEMWAKIQGSGGDDFDVFATNSGTMQRYIDGKLLAPLDLAKIPNHEQQLPRFRDLSKVPGATRDGKSYLMPYAFSPLVVIYDPKKVDPAPASWSVLWDPKYKGAVLTYDQGDANIDVAAIKLGLPNPFHLTDKEFETVKNELIGLKQQLAGYYTFVPDSVQLWQNNDVSVIFGGYGEQQIKALKAAGIDAKIAYPKEGVPAWVDTWAVTSRAKGDTYDLALKWINFATSRKVGEQLTERTGYANSVTSTDAIPENVKVFWMAGTENPSKRADLWNEVKATP